MSVLAEGEPIRSSDSTMWRIDTGKAIGRIVRLSIHPLSLTGDAASRAASSLQ
jgi:hypothetical protein